MRGSGRTGVVLVVEDELLIRADIASELKREGWEVLEAGTGEFALRVLEMDGHIDVMVTDIQLGGGLDGWDVAEASRVARPGIGVIYVSGNAANSARAVEGSVFLAKPYGSAQVLDACRALLGT